LRGDEADGFQGVVRGQQHPHAAGVADDCSSYLEQSGPDGLGACTGQLRALQCVAAQGARSINTACSRPMSARFTAFSNRDSVGVEANSRTWPTAVCIAKSRRSAV